jgi:RimJ/RimL family protein N-acetyltransferase
MNQTQNGKHSENLPLGNIVENGAPAEFPAKKNYNGKFASLNPVQPDKDVSDLYHNSHGSEKNTGIWTYMPYGPFADEKTMHDWLQSCQASIDPIFMTASSQEIKQCVGIVSFLNIVPPMRTIEIGNIWYSPLVHYSKINTEIVFLMLTEVFENLDYRRVEWKCDALNARSRSAALRLGFSFEGIFRQHYIIKGRNRDTAWFAMVDSDWPTVKNNMEQWLYSGRDNLSLTKLNRLSVKPREDAN